jgi:hypothetical protein
VKKKLLKKLGAIAFFSLPHQKIIIQKIILHFMDIVINVMVNVIQIDCVVMQSHVSHTTTKRMTDLTINPCFWHNDYHQVYYNYEASSKLFGSRGVMEHMSTRS